MGRLFAVFTILVWTSCGIAAACGTAPAKTAPPALPPMLVGGAVGGQMYYCMPTTVPTTVGDLTPTQFAQQVQICNTSCAYEPMSPGDPHSLLIPTICGPGWHETPYLVQPPPAPRETVGAPRLRLVDTGCKSLLPSKAPPPPSPGPAASPAG